MEVFWVFTQPRPQEVCRELSMHQYNPCELCKVMVISLIAHKIGSLEQKITPADMHLNLKGCLSILVCWMMPSLVLAGELSPYSPAFFLSPYQVEWDSSVGTTHTNYTINSPVLKNSANSVTNNATQGLSIGLPENYAIGITELYVYPVVSNPLNPNAATLGFKNPVLSGAKIWGLDTSSLLKISATVQPNTGVKAGLTTYNFGATGIFIGSDDWVASVGINETVNDGGDGGTATVVGTISKKIGAYMLNASAGASRFPSVLMTTGYAATSYGYAGTLELSRQILNQAWLGVNYSIGSVANTYTQNFMSIPFNNRTLYNSAGVSLKVLF